MTHSFILDKFVATKAGDAYRLFPFGKITRGGTTRDITPEYAAQFKLPPFTPPIKLGSHDDVTPAGGHLVKLEVRADGLYGYPEFTEKGQKAMEEGDYRFHSPEVIWDDGALETSDGVIAGPLIIGDALLHTPYLGNATAFYSTTTIEKENSMTQENVSISKSLLEQLLALLNIGKPEQTPEPSPEPVEETAQFKATAKERDEFKAKLETLEADKVRKETMSALTAQLQNKENYGMVYVELKAADEAAGVLSTMDETQREWVMRNFRAFITQIDETKLTGETGKEQATTTDEDPKLRFNALVIKLAEEKKINYVEAFELSKTVQADAFQAAYGKKKE